MKQIINLCILTLSLNAFGQHSEQAIEWKNQVLSDTDLYEQEYKGNFILYDFSSLWTHTENTSIYGYIGDNYQRLKMKIISVIKDGDKSDTYNITGKSKVKDNICDFSGTLKITQIRLFKNRHWGVDDEYKDKGIRDQGILIGEYDFIEDSTQRYSGRFKGIFTTLWYIDKDGHLQYDDIEKFSDSYINNQFVGTWISLTTKSPKVCNWGDFRVPFSGDLDMGACCFSPADEYLQFGWQTVRDAYWIVEPNKEARKKEEEKWWK